MSFIDNIRKSINSDYIIGAFHKKGNECYFDDLRRPSGARIKGFRKVTIEASAKTSETGLVEDEFYEFSYELESMSNSEQICQFISVGDVRPVDKNKLLKIRLDEKMQLQGTNLDDANQNQAMINQEVTGAPHTYIYELLQNSNDYPCQDSNEVKIPVEVKFIVTDHYLFFIHSGAPFNLRNIAAICTVNEGEKRNNTKTIGYKGMGFKSVFVNNDYVYLNSGGWSLRFDEKEINQPGAEERNWQYMPIATEESELDSEVLNVLHNIPKGMNVFFALRHQRDARENIPNLDKVFNDDRILVFIPYVDHVEVFVGNELRFNISKNRGHWLITDGLKIKVDEEYKSILEKSLKTDKKIPEKFQQINEISLAFAVQRDGNRLLPVSNSQVYNYLPTEQSLYVPFLINADFVPDASRKDLPDHEWNIKILEDAGHKYAKWWSSLILDSENYDLSSVFDLLPDFRDSNKFRAAFMKGFEDEIGKTKCIPIERSGERVLVPINEIIFDNMGFVVSGNPVMSDSDFYALLGIESINEYLPHPEIRQHENLKMLLTHYSKKNNIGRELNNSDLITILRSSKFEDWVKEEANAISLYRYLFDFQKINDILGSFNKIFLSESGEIKSPDQLYLDIDSYLEELYMFEDRLPRLKKSVREALPEGFRSIANYFNPFSAPTVALELSSNFDDNKDASRIKNIKDSIHFLNFLATAKDGAMRYTGDMPKTMPLYLDEGIVSGKENVYQEDERGRLLSEQPWIKSEWIHFIHNSYVSHSDDLALFLTRCDITTISPSMAWSSFIANDERSQHIISSIGDKQANIDFYYFLTNIEKEVEFTDKQLKTKYHIWVNDGETDDYVPLSTVIYWSDSKERNNLLEKEWLPEKACFAVDEDYLGQFLGEDRDAIERILKANGLVEDFSVSNWIKKCMIKEYLWPEILKNITSIETSISFLDFLFENRAYANEIGYGKLYQIPLSLEGKAEMLPVNEIKETVYQCSDDLVNLSEEPWFPSSELTSVSSAYSDLFDGADRREFFDGIGIKKFDLDEYLEEEILENLDDYTDYSDTDNALEANIRFHKFFANPSLRLSDDDYAKLKNTPIFTILPGEDDVENESGLCGVCTGFFLPSDKLGKLVELDIAPKSILHTIRPEYFATDTEQMTTYFKDKLGNRQLQDNELVMHLLAHKEEISSYITDHQRNLRFWRWAVQSSTTSEERKAFRSFKMMDSDGKLMLPNELYASAVYSKDKEAEQVIRRFIPDAHFVLEDYAKLETEEEIDWIKLFRNIKISITAEYTLLNNVLPRLCNYASANNDVVLALAGILEALKSKHNSDSKKIEDYLQNLHVKCNDNQYRKIGDAILSGEYMGVVCGKYSDIELTSQVSEDYLKQTEDNPALRTNVINLFQFLIDKTTVDVIKTAQDLAARKVEEFLANQKFYAKTDAHYRIIGELAEDCYQRLEWTDSIFKDKSLLLYSSDNRLISMDKGNLYLGSAYNPICDFQANGINTNIHYVSDEYLKHAELASIRFFLTNSRMGRIKFKFHGEAEMKYLEDSTFSTYFWSVFLPSQLKNKDSRSHFDRLLTTDTLEKYRCIPTGGGMKKPSQVYDPIDSQLVRMINVMNKQDEYLPTVKIPQEYSGGFASRLNEMDCLEYLRESEDDKFPPDDRVKVCTWLSKLPESISRSNFKNNTLLFKNNARWRNGAKKWVPLKDLCILEKTEESKHIEDHFGGSKYVCFGASLPKSNTDLHKLHILFDIPLLNKNNFKAKPNGEEREDTSEVSEIQKRLVYLSYMENSNGDWESKYKERQAKLDNAKIKECDEIIYVYPDNEGLKTTLSFLDNDDEGYMYKKGRKDQMFVSRLNWVQKTFDLANWHISVLQELFLDDFCEYVKKHNGGSLPSDVLHYLSEADRSKIETDNVEKIPDDLQQPYVSGASVPESQDTRQSEPQDHPINPNGIAEAQHTDQENKSDQDQPKVEEGNKDSPDGAVSTPESTPRPLNEKQTEEQPSKEQERQNNNKPGQPNDTSEVSLKTKAFLPTSEKSFEDRSKEGWKQRIDTIITPPTSLQSTIKGGGSVLDIEDKGDDTPNYGKVYDPNSGASIKRSPRPNTNLPKSPTSKELDNARRKTRVEEDQQARREKLSELTPYTLEWFNYLIDMQLEAVYKSQSVEKYIDLYDWALIDRDSHLYRLVSPSSFIPSNLSEASNVRIHIVNNGKQHLLNAEILEADESGIDIKCAQNFGSASATRWIRIEYQNIGGFSDAQATRFSQLNKDWNLNTNLVTKLPSNLEFIYGPPGTGKTTELVKRISEALLVNDCYNILVVTPTNRAADEIAERLAVDTHASDYLSRYGVTESHELIRKHQEILKNRHSMDLKKSNKNVMVTTIARYPYDSVQPGYKPIFDLKWDLIIVDEASMIDIVPITLLMVNNKADKFIIAGDPKQIRPVKPYFDFPDEYVLNIYDMVGMNSFKDAKEGNYRYPVKALDVQHRSVPSIGDLVSKFSYDGILKNDANKALSKRLDIPNLKVESINVIGYEVIPMSRLYDFNMVDNSAVHIYSAIFAYEFAAHIAKAVSSYSNKEHYTIGIVSPYKKQASTIQEMLSSRKIDTDKCSVNCGTVHKFQGGECDIMIVVMNYPNTNSGENANINNLNIMNVAMSRAKDYIFFLSPEKRERENAIYAMNDELFRHLPNSFNFYHAHAIEKIMFDDETFIAKNSSLKSHLPVNVSIPTGKRYEIRLSDTALDIQINDKQ